jgi:subtilisin family serine protease
MHNGHLLPVVSGLREGTFGALPLVPGRGEGVYGGGFAPGWCTSFATAHVSGVVALMLERGPSLVPDGVRRILEATATDLGTKGKDAQYGWGLVNPRKALEAVDARKKASEAAPKTQ